MKKLASLVLALALTLSLVSCSRHNMIVPPDMEPNYPLDSPSTSKMPEVNTKPSQKSELTLEDLEDSKLEELLLRIDGKVADFSNAENIRSDLETLAQIKNMEEHILSKDEHDWITVVDVYDIDGVAISVDNVYNYWEKIEAYFDESGRIYEVTLDMSNKKDSNFKVASLEYFLGRDNADKLKSIPDKETVAMTINGTDYQVRKNGGYVSIEAFDMPSYEERKNHAVEAMRKRLDNLPVDIFGSTYKEHNYFTSFEDCESLFGEFNTNESIQRSKNIATLKIYKELNCTKYDYKPLSGFTNLSVENNLTSAAPDLQSVEFLLGTNGELIQSEVILNTRIKGYYQPSKEIDETLDKLTSDADKIASLFGVTGVNHTTTLDEKTGITKIQSEYSDWDYTKFTMLDTTKCEIEKELVGNLSSDNFSTEYMAELRLQIKYNPDLGNMLKFTVLAGMELEDYIASI